MKNNLQNQNFLIYTNTDGKIKLQVNIEDETIWLNQEQRGLLYGKSKKTINEHIINIYEEEEQIKELTLKKSGISGFQQKPTNYYNLYMIISVGYRNKKT